MSLPIPTPPDVSGLPNVNAADRFGAWLKEVGRQCGEPAIDRALADWPGTPEQRRLLAPIHIETARNEARQVGSETWAKESKARGEWGV